MNAPKLFFSAAIVKSVQKVIDPKGNWQAMTVPEGVPEAVAKMIDKVPAQYPRIKLALQLLRNVKAGLYFVDAKPKVPKKLYKHECYHWERAEAPDMGGVKYFELLGWQYLIYGHDNAPEEKAADKYGGSGPLTAEEQSWLGAA